MKSSDKFFIPSLEEVREYFAAKYVQEARGLEPFLLSTYHRDYYEKYKDKFHGHKEQDRDDEGYREGFVKLADNTYIFFQGGVDRSTSSLVVGFAPSLDNLSKFIISVLSVS